MNLRNFVVEIEEKILDGTLNQTTVSKTIQFINKESRLASAPLSIDDKREIFAQCENKTEKEIEREFAILSPVAAIPDRCKQISEDGFLRQFTSDQALETKFARLRDLLAHSFSGKPTDCEVFHRLADIALEKLDPKLKEIRRTARFVSTPTHSLTNLVKPRGRKHPREPIAAETQRAVRSRDEHCCSHANPETGKRCRPSLSKLITLLPSPTAVRMR
jgi:hypothetical protein